MDDISQRFLNFARTVLDALEATKLDYLIGGSVAVWAWGEVRTTGDLDVVLNLPGTGIVPLSQELETRRMLVPTEVIFDLMIQPEGDLPINAIHMDSGFKAELFLLRPGDIFRAQALERRRLVDLGPPLGKVYVHAPEDLIINKVHYYGVSGQTKHIRDIASMLALSGDEIDISHVVKWSEQLGLAETWQEVHAEARKLFGTDFIDI